MTNPATIPMRHSASLPMLARLPKRFHVYTNHQPPGRLPDTVHTGSADDKQAVTDSGRRPSLQLDCYSDDEIVRTHDITQAVQWLKQQLIYIRQQDVMLRRQFQEIRRTLSQITPRESTTSCSSEKTSSDISSGTVDFDDDSPLHSFALRSASSYTTLTDSGDSDSSDEFRYHSCSSMTSLDMKKCEEDRREVKDYLV